MRMGGNKKMTYCRECDIVHEDKYCPLCEAQDKIKELEKALDSVQQELSKAQEMSGEQ